MNADYTISLCEKRSCIAVLSEICIIIAVVTLQRVCLEESSMLALCTVVNNLLSPGGAVAQQSGKRAPETESTGGCTEKCQAMHPHGQ